RQRQAVRAGVVLSPLERAVASRLMAGCSDKEIAAELTMAMSTVSTLAQRIRRKLGCAAGAESLHLAKPDAAGGLARRRRLFELLTAAERDVAVELVAGASYESIARERGCTKRTVAAQAASIFRKARLSGRRELAAALLGGAALSAPPQSGKSQSGKSQSGKSQSGKSQSGKSQSGKSPSGKSQ